MEKILLMAALTVGCCLLLRADRLLPPGGGGRTGVVLLLLLAFGVRFRLLELPLRTAHAPAEIRQIYSALYRQILPPAVFRAQIRLCD